MLQISYKASLLHLQPRQMRLIVTELRDDMALSYNNNNNNNNNSCSEDEDESDKREFRHFPEVEYFCWLDRIMAK